MTKFDGARIMGRKTKATRDCATRVLVRDAMAGIEARAFALACRKWLALSLAGVALGAIVAGLVV